ncbi:GNAT family N-acetyltransferase [Olivibacter sp. SDN3]|uniref:GNAT family N-acetyltransferase n=1 Tax=Olivibacter sp. SDN3 TaxID=2764720 RepID=UPI00165188B3|nr:GNAT family N-acetyltransferase [Olivibacter sp. SDN3]QNL49309.1 GNAT family N-acetyltransferase [Olivibacter sp. SDN3]
MIKIIDGTNEHIPTIQEIAYKTWPITFVNILSARQIDYMLQMMYSETALQQQLADFGHRFLLAKKGDNFLGFLSYESSYKGTNHTKIHKIYVLPQTQGMGIGKKLMETAETIAIKKGNDELRLNVNRFNEAELFYTRIGFATIGFENIDIGSGFLMEDKIMVKKLFLT